MSERMVHCRDLTGGCVEEGDWKVWEVWSTSGTDDISLWTSGWGRGFSEPCHKLSRSQLQFLPVLTRLWPTGHWWSRKPQPVLCGGLLYRVSHITIIQLFIENWAVKVSVFHLGKNTEGLPKTYLGISSFFSVHMFPSTENFPCAKQGWRPAVNCTWQRWTEFSSVPSSPLPRSLPQGYLQECSWPPMEGLRSPKRLFKAESSFSHSKVGSGEVYISLTLDCRWSTGKGNQLLWAPASFASLVVIWGNSIYLTYEMLCELWIDCTF